MVDWFCDKQVVNFSSSFPLPNTASVYIFAGGGGTVSNTEQSCVKTPGCTGACTVAFGLVAYKVIYHNSDLTLC